MVKSVQKSSLIFLILFLLSSTSASEDFHNFSRNLSPKHLGFGQEKLTHLHFFFHEIGSGKNMTAVQVAGPPPANASSTLFGLVAVMDSPLTVGPNPTSMQVGRAQGIYAMASQSEQALLMAYNFVFNQGKYNGSTLSILGRNPFMTEPVREMPIVGGSGIFRFARGYAETRTHLFDPKTVTFAVEYNLHVLHYQFLD